MTAAVGRAMQRLARGEDKKLVESDALDEVSELGDRGRTVVKKVMRISQ